MHYVIPWPDRLEGLVVCAVRGGERVGYVQRGSPRFGWDIFGVHVHLL